MPTRVCRVACVFKAPTAVDQFQPCAHGSLGVILMGLRIAEVDKDAVAHVLRDKATEAQHGFSDAFLISRDNLLANPPGPCATESAVEPTKSENITVT